MHVRLVTTLLALAAILAPAQAAPAFAQALCHCRCGIVLRGPCGPADCMRACGYDSPPPPQPQPNPDIERFDRERARLGSELESVLDARGETSDDVARARQRLGELETRLDRAREEEHRLSAAQDEVARLERETGVDPITSEAQIQQRAAALAPLGAMAEAAANRVWDNVVARRSLLDVAFRGIARALAVDVRTIRLLADPSGIGRRMLDRLVPPPATAAPEPARALSPPARALTPPAQALPPLPAEGSLDWAALQQVRAAIADLRVHVREQQSELRQLRQDGASASSALAAIDLQQVRDDTRSVEQRRGVLRTLSGAVEGVRMPAARTVEHLGDVGATVLVQVAGRAQGAPEELWVALNQKLTHLTDTASGAWELPAGVRLKTPSKPEVARWVAVQAAGRVSREALSRMPPVYGQVARVAGFGRFYRNQVERVIADASRLMTDAARAGAYGSVDEMQAVADRAQLPAIAVERDALARLTRTPLSWFVEVDGDPKR